MSGTDLTQMPGDAALSGVQANFDPNNKAPFAALQNTFDRIDSEEKQSVEQHKQRQFQEQQQQRSFDHDLLSQKMQMEQQMKMLQFKEGIQKRDDFYNMMNEIRVRGGNLKDPNGNPMPLLPLDEDKPLLQKDASDLNKIVLSDPTGYKFNDEFQQKFADYEAKTANATARSRYYKEAQIALSQTADPEERQNIATYMENLKKGTLKDVPNPYVSPRLTFQPVIDQTKFKDKDLEQFDNGKGIPQSQFNSILYTSDGKQLDQGFRTYQAFKNMPQGQDPKAYEEYQKHLNEIQLERGQPAIDLGGRITQDGKLVFDEGSRGKQIELARKFLYADQLMHSGQITPYSEDEKLESEKLKAQVEKEKAVAEKDRVEAAMKQKEMETGKSVKPTTEELKQEQTKQAVRSMYKQAQSVFKQTGKQVTGKDPALWSSWWQRNGVNIGDYNVYGVASKGAADKYIGLEEPQKTIKTTGKKNETTEKTIKGESTRPDNVYLLQDKKTGEKVLAYIKDNSVIARVSEKEAVVNGLKHESKYDPARYDDKVAWVEDVYNRAGQDDAPAAKDNSQSSNSDEAVIRARLVPIQVRKPDGSIVTLMKDPQTGKRYNP